MRRVVFLAVVMLCAVALRAQRSGIPPMGRPIPPLAPIPPMGITGLSVPGTIPPAAVCCPPFLTHRSIFPRSNFFGFFPPFFDGFFSPETVFVPEPSQAPPPAPQVVETSPPSEPSEPLLIEREGNGFVRYGGARAGSQPSARGSVKSLAEYRSSSQTAPAAAESHPAILVFRDGHRQEVAQYTISGSVLYAYAAGQTVPIRLADLDIAATTDLNRQRGITFSVPATQNEIVISF